jgi:predicted AlkP superfamily pyrophosphatase or phosphodiesterase
MLMDDSQVLNVLRWATPRGDARETYPPESLQTGPAFEGQRPPIVVRAEFRDSGFSRAHLPNCRHIPYRMPSTFVSEVLHQLRAGEPFVYAYYDGIDKVSHEYGLGEVFAAEMIFIDRMVEYLIENLPRGVALVITADHGQVDVGENVMPPAPEVLSHVAVQSGEARFRWLHAHPGAEQSLLETATGMHSDVAWVVSADEMIEDEWFGPAVKPGAAARLGDVALVCREAVAFEDPADTGPFHLVGRHGSMTSDEVHVPLLVAKNI